MVLLIPYSLLLLPFLHIIPITNPITITIYKPTTIHHLTNTFFEHFAFLWRFWKSHFLSQGFGSFMISRFF